MTLAERGIKLFPLMPNSKIPYPKWSWPQLNSSDIHVLSGWQYKYPGCNFGALCGPDSQLAVLDWDVKNGKPGLEEYRRDLELYGADWANTIHVRTWSGGKQTYHLWRSGVVKDNTGKIGPGVDCQGLGTYVVSAGSTVNSVRYVFDGCDGRKPLSLFPDWALEKLGRDQERQEQKKTGRTNGTGKYTAGARTNALISYAGRVFNARIEFEDFLDCIWVWNLRHCEPPLDKAEILRQADCYHRWKRKAAKVPGFDPAEDTGNTRGRMFSEIHKQPIEWVWKPYMATGMITLLSGDPGAGKSFIALDRSAEITRIGGFVLYLSVENPPEQVLVPRFEALSGDPNRIKLIEGVEYGDPDDGVVRGITLRDLKILEKEIKCHKEVRLIVVDPVQSYLGEKVDAHRSNETRPVLDGLSRLCGQYGIVPLILRHCSKASTGKVLYRGLGSIDFTAAARSELIVGEHDGKMAMAHLKSNLSKKGPALGYEIVEAWEGRIYETGFFRWTGECEFNPEDLVDDEPDTEEDGAIDEAKSFLAQMLADGPVLSNEIIAAAKQAGIAERTLRRARVKLGVKARKRRKPDPRWEWFLHQDGQG